MELRDSAFDRRIPFAGIRAYTFLLQSDGVVVAGARKMEKDGGGRGVRSDVASNETDVAVVVGAIAADGVAVERGARAMGIAVEVENGIGFYLWRCVKVDVRGEAKEEARGEQQIATYEGDEEEALERARFGPSGRGGVRMEVLVAMVICHLIFLGG